jgi:hypothetical protein
MFPCNAITPTVAFLEGAFLITRHVRMAERVMPIHVGIPVVLEVIARGLDAVPETVTTDFIVAIREGIPAAAADWRRHICRRPRSIRRRLSSHMRHGNVVPTEETIPIGLTHRSGNARVTVFETVIRVWAAMVCDVIASGFDTLVEPAALNVIPGIIRAIPITAILCETGGERRQRESVRARCREQQECRASAKTCDAKPIEFHV